MALTQTTLANALTADALFITVTSATGFVAGQSTKIDQEYVTIGRDYVSGTFVPIYRRGDNGSVQQAHNALAIVVTGAATDWNTLAAGNPTANVGPWPSAKLRDQTTYSVSGAIAIPNKDQVIIIDKAGVAAMTLAAPTKDQDGLTLTITSTTAQAHTLTATGLFSTGTASVNLATFAAQKGSGLTIMAMQGLWNVIASPGITFS